MCGLAGIVSGSPDFVPAPGVMEAMLRRIRHRGPDDRGQYHEPGVSLGHNRLAIIDPGNARQPMESPDKRFVLIFNGEIYNFMELREQLELKGVCFSTRSDTEVLLQWLMAHDTKGLARLNGMFAFALWDKNERSLLLGRDRLGIKPLYWSLQKNCLVFASEIKALLPALPKPTPRLEAIYQFLSFQNLFGENTFFKDVRRFKPGSWLRFSNGRITQGQYWDLTFEPGVRNFDQAVDEYREILDRSVRRHMIADVPVGAYLSGGIDSGEVVMAASSLASEPLATFTGAFTDSAYYDERGPAAATAKAAGARAFNVEITDTDYRNHIHKIIHLLDEPTLGTGALPQFVVAGLAARHVKVVLTGHGGDEMFGGYQVNKAVLFRELLSARPLAALRLLPQVRRDEVTRFLYYLLYPLLYPEVGFGHFIMTPQKNRPSFFSGDFLAQVRDFEPLDAFRQLLAGHNETESERLTRIYLQAYLPTLLTQEDRMSMGHSLEGRTPLCDNEFLDLSRSLPLSLKLRGGELKAVPRQALRGLLPAVLYVQPKRGFPTPFARWYRREPLNSYLRDILADTRTKERGIFKAEEVARLFQSNAATSRDSLWDYARANIIWSSLAVEIWFRTFIDSDGAEPLPN